MSTLNSLHLSLGITVLLLSACSQPPAPIANKGNQFFGRDAVSRYAAAPSMADPMPVHQRQMASAAAIEDVRVEETAPITVSEAPMTLAPLPEISVSEVPATFPEAEPQPTFQTASYSASTPANADYVDIEAPKNQVAKQMPALEPLPIAEAMPEIRDASAEAAFKAEAKASLASAASNKPVMASKSSFIWPTQGNIVSRFGPKKNGLVNDGINIEAIEGEPIWAAAAGEVAYAGNELKGYGNMLILRHDNGYMTAYAHASDLLVRKGDKVKQGDLIGYVGKSGAVSTAQLHFGIRNGKQAVDPESFLPQQVASAY